MAGLSSPALSDGYPTTVAKGARCERFPVQRPITRMTNDPGLIGARGALGIGCTGAGVIGAFGDVVTGETGLFARLLPPGL